MRVLLITPRPGAVGGIARWTEAFLDYFYGNIDVEIVDNSLLPYRKSKASVFFSQIKRTKFIFSELSKKTKKRKVDVAHINTSCSRFGIIRDYYCVRKLKRKGIPIVLQCHCNIDDQLGHGKVPNSYFKKLVKLSNRVLVLNQKSLEYVKKISLDKGEICPNFISKDRVLSSSLHTNNEVKQIVYVGHMYKSKGVLSVLELAKAFPNITFKFVGPCEDFLKTESNIPTNAYFTGGMSLQEVVNVLDESDVFVLLSYSEGFSNAMLEAMARGLPILATDVGAARDMIQDKGGVIVDVEDITSAVRAVEHMLPKAIREQMAIWNIEKVKREYASEVVLGKLEEIYDDLLIKK